MALSPYEPAMLLKMLLASYLGLAKFAIQGYLTAMALNLKRMIELLFGVSFRNQAYQAAKVG